MPCSKTIWSMQFSEKKYWLFEYRGNRCSSLWKSRSGEVYHTLWIFGVKEAPWLDTRIWEWIEGIPLVESPCDEVTRIVPDIGGDVALHRWVSEAILWNIAILRRTVFTAIEELSTTLILGSGIVGTLCTPLLLHIGWRDDMCHAPLLTHASWSDRDTDESLIDRLHTIRIDRIMGTVL